MAMETHKRIALIGAPVDEGAGHGGCLMGPAALRTAGLVRALGELGHTVEDQGDLSPEAVEALTLDGNARNAPAVAGWTRSLADASFRAFESGTVPIFLGGDHSLSMGSVTGAARWAREQGRELFVLWLDAHADFNTPATSPSGNLHGMPVAFYCGEAGFDGLLDEPHRALVDPAHVTMMGIRSIDRGERDLVTARGIEVVDMRQIDEGGVVKPLRRFLERVAARGSLLHVSFDVDFLTPSVAPGVGTTVPGGATYREAHLIMEMLYDSGLVSSLDVVELNPFLDERGRSALVLVDLVASLFGRRVIDRPTQPAWTREHEENGGWQ